MPERNRALRSDVWFSGGDETSLLHRAALGAGVGARIDAGGDRPVIGIANSSSELNPCNLPLGALARAVKEGVWAAGGTPAEFPTMSLGEDLMKPSAMLYRNLLAMEIEETLRSYPLDGVVILAGCDKTVPGALMGAVSADLPAIVVTSGARSPAVFRGRRIGTGTDLWRLWDDRRAGLLDEAGWAELEGCLSGERGTCNTMGTASTMALVTEALGLMLPGASTIPAGASKAAETAFEAGRRVVALVAEDLRPSRLLTEAAFANAVRVLNAVGGSTNAVIHLAAIAGRAGVPLSLRDIERLGSQVPVVADIEPSGSGLMQDLDAAGGLPTVMRSIREVLELSAGTVGGVTLEEVVNAAPEPSGAIRDAGSPLMEGGAFVVVRGSLAPDGALLKRSAASPVLLAHRGPAVVFNGYEEMLARVDDPALAVAADSVLLLAGGGPIGAPGMPEWGMVPIPAKLLARGVRDMVRVTDARMSGTSFGTVFVHAAPEGAVGGPIGLARDGDMVRVDAIRGEIELEVGAEELGRRRAGWRAPSSPHLRGWPALYQRHVTQAPEGCDLDFLSAPTPAHRIFVAPVVGRS